KGFLSKDAPVEEIKKAINLVLNNKKYYSDSMLESLIDDDATRQNENPFEKLSEREFAITNLLLKGMTLTEVSAALNIQMSTTGTHKARIFEKLNVKNILQLSELAKLYQINT
ncbi:MAG: LuxR C-terminal-related transcriptional regulator, partial [Chitinophagaceae bacterium]